MEDEAEIYDGIRAQFPLTFGKQAKSQTPLEKIHSATRRSDPLTTTTAATDNEKNNLPSISSSSKEWLGTLRNPKSSDAAPIGPPPPPPRQQELEADDDDVVIGPPRPPQQQEDDADSVIIGPPRPPAESGDDDDDVDEEEGEENWRQIPMSNEIVLKGHTKVIFLLSRIYCLLLSGWIRVSFSKVLVYAENDIMGVACQIVSALAVDHSGSRVLSGSYDYTVRMYDFQGMNSRLQSFRQLEPAEGHQVRNMSWSPTSDRFLCVTGSAQAKVLVHASFLLLFAYCLWHLSHV